MNHQIICYCSNVTQQQIEEAMENGAETLDAIRRTTGACTVANCKELSPTKQCCSPKILELLAAFRESRSR